MPADSDERDESYDPRTWLSGRPGSPAPQPVPSTNAPDFDVRNWVAGASPATAETRPPSPLRRWPLAAGAAAALAATAIAGTLLLRGGDPEPGSPATASAAAGHISSRRTLTLTNPDQLLGALRTAGADPRAAAQAADAVRTTFGSGTGDIRLIFDLAGTTGRAAILRLEATRPDGSGVSLSRKDNGFAAERLDANLVTEIRIARGQMDSNSFYTSAVSAGVLDSLTGDFTNAFNFDFDMQRDIGLGDTFEAGYAQRINPAGEPVGAPELVYAALKTRALYRFQAPDDTAPGWYDGNGRSAVRSMMRTPLDVARITSGFGYRLHPIQGYRKLHRGTDFAAPVGTPIFAAGNAMVETVAPLHGAAGNFVVLRHDNGWQTRYMHLDHFAPGLAMGTRIAQGAPIGVVGMTGGTTGPHLHFEVWIDGQPVDSQSVDTGTGKTLAGAALKAFLAQRDRVDDARGKQEH